MATGPCEVLERKDECPDPTKELSAQEEDIQRPLKEESKEDAKKPPSKEEVISTPNGIEKGDTDKLHVVEKDLDEFVDSMTEAMPAEVPKKPSEVGKIPAPEKAPAKSPRAEQVAEKVLRAERVAERPPPRMEKPAVAEKAPEPKGTRVEKAPRAEKPAEKPRPAAQAPKTIKRRTGAGAAKDTLPWEGLTLNKCLLVASFVALLSVSCQVVQDIIDYGENVLMTELSTWTLQDASPQDGSLGELDERWFYERWLDWSDTDEPLEIEEEEDLIEMEEQEGEEEPADEEEEIKSIEEEEEQEEEEEGLAEEEEEVEEEPVAKLGPKKSREKVSRREKVPKVERVKGHKAPKEEEEEEEDEEEEEEEKHPPGRRPRQERKGKEERQHQEERKGRPSKEPKRERRPKEEEPERKKGRPKHEKDSKSHPHEQKDRKSWQAERSFFPSQKFGKHRVQEGKRHD